MSKGFKNIVLIAGARPNFMKIASIIEAIEKANANGDGFAYSLVHTGQHYDANMSDNFFLQLGIPEPSVNLEAGGGSQAEQTSAIMVGFEKYLLKNNCDLVVVVGDVTSTLACSIVAKKLNIPVAHVEGGIRSGDMQMPEEINRLVTDSIADYFFTTSRLANDNLLREGKNEEQIFFVGNTMIDTLLKNMDRFRKPEVWDNAKLTSAGYFVLTLHRPSNVDTREQLQSIIRSIEEGADGLPVVFPVHPRTRKKMADFGIVASQLHLLEPLGYLEFNYLVKHAKAVITDSGGITEETTVMNIPCITLRNNTERPETITTGTNELIGTNPVNIIPALEKVIAGKWKRGNIPELWDGRAGERIVNSLMEL